MTYEEQQLFNAVYNMIALKRQRAFNEGAPSHHQITLSSDESEMVLEALELTGN